MLQLLKHGLRRFYQLHPAMRELQEGIDTAKALSAKLLIEQIRGCGVVSNPKDAEFRVHSQFGEDGIIQYLLMHVPVPNRRFVEFGVGNYQEANTRFLLVNDNWSGLILDGDEKNMAFVRNAPRFWMSDLTAVTAFIDRDNISGLIAGAGFSGPIGILSVDIDGNDYWVWEALAGVDAAIVIGEYNSVFGSKRAVTVPYNPSFYRYDAHYSGLYWGASLRALCVLADRKGYAFVGSNSAGNNAFFVKKELVGSLPTFDAASGYVESKFRDSRDRNGRLNCLSGVKRAEAIEAMPVYDVEVHKMISVGEAVGRGSGEK
jgi:hypothetical protein